MALLALNRRCLLVALLACVDAHAGLSLDSALQRQHGQFGAAPAALSSATPQLEAPDSIATGFASDAAGAPLFLPPIVGGRAGVQMLVGGGAPEALIWRLGLGWADATEPHFNLDGSELSVPLGPGRAYVSQQRRHWGPGWGSLILDEAAAPIPALGWRKTDPRPFDTAWLAWLGPWSADFFLGTLSGHTQPQRPRLWGARVQFMPVDGLEIGVSRVVEWGGRGRSESLATFWKTVIGHDNVDNGADNPGNQLGGFDARYTRPIGAERAVSVYAQVIGEDEADYLPSRRLGSVGVDLALALDREAIGLFAEYANSIAGGFVGRSRPGIAYRHSRYLEGYTQRGQVLGLPAGGDVTLATVGLLIEHAPHALLLLGHRGTAHAGAQLFAPGRIGGANAELAWRFDAKNTLGAAASLWRSPDQRSNRLQLWWRHTLR